LFEQAPIYQGGAPAPAVSINRAGLTTITALNLDFIKLVNVGAVTITTITGGVDGRTVKFLGDGFTSFDNNATIKPNTGALKLLALNKVYSFTYLSGVWYEAE
jgi:hypothetical protein